MYCTKCGKENNANSLFCTSCGNKFTSEVNNTNSTKQFFAQVIKKPLFLALVGVAITIVAYAAIFSGSSSTSVEKKNAFTNPFNTQNSNKGELYFRLVGGWFGSTLVYNPDFFFLLPGNKVYKGVPPAGLDSLNFSEARQKNPKYTGTYKIDGNKMTITLDNGEINEYQYEQKEDGFVLNGDYTKKVKIFPKDQKLNGYWYHTMSPIYSLDNNSRILSLTLYTDGRFTKREQDSGTYYSGTYLLYDNVIVFNYTDGKTERYTIFPFGDNTESESPEFLNIDGNMYHLEK